MVDLLPFSESIAPGGQLELQRDLVLNMAGFEQAVTSAVQVAVDDGPVLPVVPLPLYVLLKLVSFDDRKAPKDLASVFHCLRYYLDEDDRRYLAEHAGSGVPFEYAGAYWLGADGQPFLSGPLARVVRPVLGRFAHPDAEAVGAEPCRSSSGRLQTVAVAKTRCWPAAVPSRGQSLPVGPDDIEHPEPLGAPPQVVRRPLLVRGHVRGLDPAFPLPWVRP